MKLVVIESPYAGNIDANVAYARSCMADSLRRGEAPFASHLLYTQPNVLRDAVSGERDLGIVAGFAWRKHADVVAFYVERGMSDGMKVAYVLAQEQGLLCDFRTLDNKCPCHYIDEVWVYEPPDSSGWDRQCSLCKRIQHGTFPNMSI